jgi:hypothetical protein
VSLDWRVIGTTLAIALTAGATFGIATAMPAGRTSLAETLQSVGDELAALARDSCPNESERRQLIDGLEGALRALGLSDAAQVHIVSQLAPRIMAGEPASASKEAWTRMAV